MVDLKSVGVLALQGDFEKHLAALKSLGVATKLIRTSSDFSDVDGLIIPGGESTTMTNLLRRSKLEKSLRDFVMKNPVMGTCAGLILLSNQSEYANVIGLGVIDVDIDRNGYGSQRDSFSADISLNFDDENPFHAVFIRAPKIMNIGSSVTALAELNGEVVMARNSNVLVTSFHPELSENRNIHNYFVKQFVQREEVAA
ncbi:MAG: pyridoxal 5'-phosphate synthase glutaminase subunit PdxT [Candidatus Marinimicrobia bacterium]|nr:pyridoxal 5'-phosphate synthase glutaminase subunit PdxT [Candidatus Neomarinimicrobiota bacterium]